MTTNATDLSTAADPRVEPDRRHQGVLLAGITAVVSGFAVFVNSYGVRRFDDPTTYTTAKNLVAAAVIAAIFAAGRPRSRSSRAAPPRWVLVAVAVIGGSVPFVLFFEGLARVSSSDAAFIHKTLVAWVAVLGVVVLGERLSAPHLVAIALILVGHATLMSGVTLPALGPGEVLILSATLCWSVEVVLSRWVLRRGVDEVALGTARMGGGVVVLLGWAAARGALGELFGLSAEQWQWVLLTGVFLSAYVISWHLALARAQAVDVTAVLVIGAIVTALLNAGVKGVAVEPVGLGLLGAGAVMVAATMFRPRRAVVAP